jgi:hypothetical protein
MREAAKQADTTLVSWIKKRDFRESRTPARIRCARARNESYRRKSLCRRMHFKCVARTVRASTLFSNITLGKAAESDKMGK